MGKTRDLFKKIRDTKGTFHAKIGLIKDRNGMDPDPSSKATLWVKAQHEGALPPPCQRALVTCPRMRGLIRDGAGVEGVGTGRVLMRGLEGVPGLPGAPQDEAGLTRIFET